MKFIIFWRQKTPGWDWSITKLITSEFFFIKWTQFFIKSTKIGVFYQYEYTDITTFRDPCSINSRHYALSLYETIRIWLVSDQPSSIPPSTNLSYQLLETIYLNYFCNLVKWLHKANLLPIIYSKMLKWLGLNHAKTNTRSTWLSVQTSSDAENTHSCSVLPSHYNIRVWHGERTTHLTCTLAVPPLFYIALPGQTKRW